MLKLVRPTVEYLQSYREAVQEDQELRDPAIHQLIDPAQAIEQAYNFEHGIDLPEGYVPATTFWLVETTSSVDGTNAVDANHKSGRFIGRINIRHKLTPFLLRYGGHIGYEVRVSETNKGFGTQMLAMVLPYCKHELKFDRLLITCDDTNIASSKVIEHNGGVLENKVKNMLERGEVLTRRYWIEL